MGNLLARVGPVLVVRFEITTGKAGRARRQINASGEGVQTNVVPRSGTTLEEVIVECVTARQYPEAQDDHRHAPSVIDMTPRHHMDQLLRRYAFQVTVADDEVEDADHGVDEDGDHRGTQATHKRQERWSEQVGALYPEIHFHEVVVDLIAGVRWFFLAFCRPCEHLKLH